ncbi:MAG: FtsX-like permease family protein [Erythrobacter sp.]
MPALPFPGRNAPVAGNSAPLLPEGRTKGPIPWVIAILIALVVVAAAGGLALRNLAEDARGDLAGALTVQIVEADPAARAALAEQVGTVLGRRDAVRSVRIVPESELEALLEPWLGAGVESGEVPIPALVDVELRGPASRDNVEALRAVLAQALEGDASKTRIDAQSDWLEPVYDALAALQYLALVLIVLIGAATAAAVWLSARSAFANHRDTVEVIHLLGASDAQVTRVFQRSVLRDAAIGAGIGLVIGVAAVWLLGQQFDALDGGMTQGGGLGVTDWLVIALIPVAAVALSLLTARITIGLALRSLL